MKVKSLSRVGLSANPWTAAYQAPPPLGFSRQEYWSGVPLPSPNMLLFNKISSYPILGEDGKLEPIIISCGLLFILDVVLHNPSSFFSPGTVIPSFLHFLIGSVLCRITILLTAKASRKQSSWSGKESAQGCIPKRLLGRPD